MLRLKTGDRLVGLDGRGESWPLEVASVARDRLTLASAGERRLDPRPGTKGAPLPWIEVAVPWPKGGRVEEMLDRLTQLGAAAIAPLACARAGPHSREQPANRRERLERVLREACKQSGRTWLPVLRDEGPTGGARGKEELSTWGAARMDEDSTRGGSGMDEDPTRGATGKIDALILDPEAERSLPRWIHSRIEAGTTHWNSQQPLVVLRRRGPGRVEFQHDPLPLPSSRWRLPIGLRRGRRQAPIERRPVSGVAAGAAVVSKNVTGS